MSGLRNDPRSFGSAYLHGSSKLASLFCAPRLLDALEKAGAEVTEDGVRLVRKR
jgi:hypothetical protein